VGADDAFEVLIYPVLGTTRGVDRSQHHERRRKSPRARPSAVTLHNVRKIRESSDPAATIRSAIIACKRAECQRQDSTTKIVVSPVRVRVSPFATYLQTGSLRDRADELPGSPERARPPFPAFQAGFLQREAPGADLRRWSGESCGCERMSGAFKRLARRRPSAARRDVDRLSRRHRGVVHRRRRRRRHQPADARGPACTRGD
jgi:hypothetical protein